MAVSFPIAAFNDLGHGWQGVHDVDPTGNICPIIKFCREQLAVVEPRIAFQPIHRLSIFKGDLNQLGRNCVVSLRHERRKAIAGIVECAGNRAWRDADSVPAEAVVAFPGHQRSVDDKFDSVRFVVFLFLVKLFLML